MIRAGSLQGIATLLPLLLAFPAAAATPRTIPAATAASAKPGTMCGVCHSDTRVAFGGGKHLSEGLGCVSCHGGDATATTVEAAHRAPFRGAIARRDIPVLCASCHADVARMRPYNLPSDQLALYQTSKHGMRLAQGDDKVAVCTDCHGVHDIRPPADPKSTVFAGNIAATCGRCHSDPTLMRAYGHVDDPAAEYKEGVHGKALFAGGRDAAPDCTRCHGSHGATPPGTGDVAKVCGQCHGKVRTYFLAGPHKAGMDAAGQPECTACHGKHRTQPATMALLDKICLDCHAAGSDEVKVAATFTAMYTQAADDVARAEERVDEAARIPLYVDDYRARLTDARTALMECAPVMHALDPAQVEPLTRHARSIAAEVSGEIRQKLSERIWRYVGLVLCWFYLLLTATIVLRARRRDMAKGAS